MTTDKTMKILLAAIAVGLWMNVLSPWIQPAPAWADANSDIRRISSMMPSIKSDLGKVIRELGKISINLTSLHNELTGVSRGGCANPKICEVADRRGAGQH